jgi:hypothetical protein
MIERTCDCPHHFPLCACAEGLRGSALRDRSRWLSALAGWPARVDPAEAKRVIAEHMRPPEGRSTSVGHGHGHASQADIPRLSPSEMHDLNSRMKECPHRKPTRECGCGGLAICGLDRQKIVNPNDCILCLIKNQGSPLPGTER